MSYILDALKKIEHEKHKKGPNGTVNISGDLFRERTTQPQKTAAGKIAVFVAAVVLIACSGTWFVLHKENRKTAASIQPVIAPPAATVVPVAVQTPSPVPVQPQPVQAPAPPVVANTSPQLKTGGDSVPVRSVRRQQKQGRVKPSSPSPQQNVVLTVPAPADVKLSGIAWQDDRSARRAVINGFLLKEGAMVSGAKITDIQADRVRFVSPAGKFEIRLDAVLPAEVKK
jgi:general secretion pathway protein B